MKIQRRDEGDLGGIGSKGGDWKWEEKERVKISAGKGEGEAEGARAGGQRWVRKREKARRNETKKSFLEPRYTFLKRFFFSRWFV